MELLIALIIIIAVTIGLFLLLRKAVLWYFRIPEQIELQKETNKLLRRIADNGYRG